MVFKIAANGALGIPDLSPLVVDDTARCAIGTRAKGYDDVLGEGEFIYLPGAANVAEGDFVAYDLTPGAPSVTRSLAATHANKGWPLAVAAAALGAATYGWYQVTGIVAANVAAGYAAGAVVMLTATAGTVDDAAVAGAQVLGAKGLTAIATPAAGKAYVQIAHPHVQGQIT